MIKITPQFILVARILIFVFTYVSMFGLITTFIDIFSDISTTNLILVRLISFFTGVFFAFITKITFNKKS